MPERLTGRLSVASFNTWGIHILGSDLAARYTAIGAEFEAGRADAVCFQEVLSYWHLRLLTRRMPSFRHVSYRPSAVGPAGGLVTFSRRPVAVTAYRGFGTPPKVPGISRMTRFRARPKGALVTRLAHPALCIVNTHPVANWDGDWSRTSRFYPLHRAHLDALARIVASIGVPAVVCGDFNVDRDSSLFGDFMAETGLADAFEGRCPPTFRAEYLPAGKTPHCIDFILTTTGVKAASAGVLFAGQIALPGGPGYPSDHIGLHADLLLTSSALRPGPGTPGPLRHDHGSLPSKSEANYPRSLACGARSRPTRLRRRGRSEERARRPARHSSGPIPGAGPAPRLSPDHPASR